MFEASDFTPEKHRWFAGRTPEGRAILSRKEVDLASDRNAFLLGTRLQRSNDMPRDKGVVVFPASPYTDPIITADKQGRPNANYVRFLNHLRNMVEDLGMAELDHGAMVSEGLPGDLTRLLTLAGFPGQPMTAPDVFNDYRAKPITDFLDVDHLAIATELRDAMLGEWEPKYGYRIARESTAGFPYWTFDVDAKLRIAYESMERMSHIGSLADKGQLSELYSSTSILLAYYATYRLQQDGAQVHDDGSLTPKQRPVYGVDYSTGRVNDVPMAEKGIAGLRDPAFRQRVRLAYGMGGGPNYPTGALMSGFRDVYLDEYAPTWVTRGADDLASSISGWYVVGVDVEQFDSTLLMWQIHFFLDGIAEKFPAFGSLLRLMAHAPVFTPRQGPNSPGFWTGDPLDVTTFASSVGLASGVAFNPDVGKFVGTLQGLIILHELFGGVVGRVKEILKHHHPDFALKNMGDDMLFKLRTEEARDILHDALRDTKHPVHARSYLKFGLESPITYLGWALYAEGRGLWRVEPAIGSVLVNWLSPERGAGSSFRQYPALGWFMREEHFRKSRMYEPVAAIRDKLLRHYFGLVPDDAFAQQYLEEKSLLGGLNEADLALLAKPERMHYTNDAQHSAVMIDVLSASIPAMDIIRYLQPLMRK